MEVLHSDQLDEVAGGIVWYVAVALFAYLNLEKLRESWNGLSDGFAAGFSGADSGAGATCTP